MADRQDTPLIGIVGGMGPYAGLDLARKVFDQTVASTDQEHIPLVLVSLSDRIPDRSAFLHGKSTDNPVPAIFESLQRLEAAGATIAGISCVTAHAPPILAEVKHLLRQSGSRIRVISIVEATRSYIRHLYPDVRSVASLSTTESMKSRLFQDVLESDGFEIVWQSDEIQRDLVEDAIFNRDYGLKAISNPATSTARQKIEQAIQHVRDRGAEVVILGCTELPLAVPGDISYGVRLVDPALALARVLIRETYPERLRQTLS